MKVKVINALSQVIQYRLHVALRATVTPLHHLNLRLLETLLFGRIEVAHTDYHCCRFQDRGIVANLCPLFGRVNLAWLLLLSCFRPLWAPRSLMAMAEG